MKRPVYLTAANLQHINVREWGLPTGVFIGKVWRSERRRIVVCILPVGRSTAVNLDTRPVLIVDRPEHQWIPASWRSAMARYRADWLNSAPRLRGVP